MRINKLTIENFRSYETKTEFTFKGNNDINVILGQNGTGKTSFLSAIKYVLFGPRTFGSDFYTKEYINWANREINFNSSSNEFEVGLQFIYNEQLIDVVRTSKLNNVYEEDVVLFIGGTKQKDDSFLENFNYNLFNNIFFNGENISLLTSSDKQLQNFTRSLIDVYFELDVFKNIVKDTENAINRNLKEVATNKYNILIKELKRNESKVESYTKSLNSIESEIENNQVKLSQLKSEMEKRNALSATEEDDIHKKVDSAKQNLEAAEHKLVEFLKGDAHRILMNKVLGTYNQELANTRESRLKSITSIYQALETGQYVNLSELKGLDLNTEIKIANNYLEFDDAELIANIKAFKKAKSNLTRNQNKLKASEEGKKLLNFNLNYEFLETHAKELEKKFEAIETKLNLKQVERNEIVSKIELEKKKMLDDELLNNAIIEKQNLIDICNKYLDVQSNIVFHQIAGTMENVLKKHLLRKENLIDSIAIIDYKLSISKDGKVRPIESFSAGEQQLFLIALIFAVLKQARIEVPLILDTFFARIDDLQQNNLIEFLCNELENQILFIATDSELPKAKLEKFSNINKVYKLENNGYKTTVGVIDEN